MHNYKQLTLNQTLLLTLSYSILIDIIQYVNV